MESKEVVLDMNNNPVLVGCDVLVHQDEETTIAKVIELFPDNPTKNKPGHWVDIDKGDGYEGMMSYIIEAYPEIRENG